MSKTLTPSPAQADAISTLQAGVEELSKTVPAAVSSTLTRAVSDAEDLTRRGIERARQASLAVREQAIKASDQTIATIQHKPVQSVLVAAAAGALIAALVGWAARSRRD